MEFMPTTANGKAQARRFHTSVRRENAPRNRKHQPPPKRNQLGVQIFLTTGQVPATPQSQPEAQPTMPAMANQRTLASGLFLFDASEDAVESADDHKQKKKKKKKKKKKHGRDAASDQTEDHGAEGRDETKGRVAAAVVAEPVVRREKIQEPGVEGPGRVGVQAPMSGESGEHLVGFDACFGPVEVRSGQRIEGKEKPVTDEYDCQRGPLDADRAQAE